MLRKTLTIVSLIGLLLSLAAWGVGYWDYHYSWQNDAVSFRGGRVGWWHRSNHDNGSTGLYQLRFNSLWSGVWPYYERSDYHGLISHIFSLPLWIPTVFFTTLFWWSVLPLHRRRKRKKLGLCLKCGYDLRGSSERCPECGQEFEKQ